MTGGAEERKKRRRRRRRWRKERSNTKPSKMQIQQMTTFTGPNCAVNRLNPSGPTKVGNTKIAPGSRDNNGLHSGMVGQ